MRTILLVVALSLLSPGGPARADKTGPPQSYTKVSPDRKHVFVMLAPGAAGHDGYTKSGMYPNDGSRKPTWTVTWYSPHVTVADADHVIAYQLMPPSRVKRKEELNKQSLAQEGISFHAGGKLLKSYAIGDLIAKPEQVTRSVSHFRWMKGPTLSGKEASITTTDGERVVFDITTGKVKERGKEKK